MCCLTCKYFEIHLALSVIHHWFKSIVVEERHNFYYFKFAETCMLFHNMLDLCECFLQEEDVYNWIKFSIDVNHTHFTVCYTQC